MTNYEFFNLLISTLGFVILFSWTGNVVERFLRLNSGVNGAMGIGTISFLSVTYAQFKSDFKYLVVGVLAILIIYSIVTEYETQSQVKRGGGSATELFRYRLQRVGYEASEFIILFLPSYLFWRPALKAWGLGISALGNLDPLMYGIVSKHIENYGFSNRMDLLNLNLGAHAAWDWVGTMSLFAFSNTTRALFPAGHGVAYLAFIFAIAICMVKACVDLIVRFSASQSTLRRLIAVIFVSIGIYSQVNLYIFGNGFLAQIVFMALTPAILSMLLSILGKDYESQGRTSIFAVPTRLSGKNSVTLAFLLGISFCIYFVGALVLTGSLIVIYLCTKVEQRLYSRAKRKPIQAVKQMQEVRVWFFNFRTLKPLAIFTIAAIPSYAFLKIFGPTLGSGVKVAWVIPKFSLWSLLPTTPLCQPVPNQLACTSKFPVFEAVIYALILFLAARGLSRGRAQSSHLAKIVGTYLVFLIVGTVIKFGVTQYSGWKMLSMIGFVMFAILIPFCALRGLDFKIQNAHKDIVTSLLLSVIFAASSFALFDSVEKASGMWVKSIWSYGSNRDAVALAESRVLRELPGINIDAIGAEGMYLTLYAPTNQRIIVGIGTYFTQMAPQFEYTLVAKANPRWSGARNKVSLNSKYGLIHESVSKP